MVVLLVLETIFTDKSQSLSPICGSTSKLGHVEVLFWNKTPPGSIMDSQKIQLALWRIIEKSVMPLSSIPCPIFGFTNWHFAGCFLQTPRKGKTGLWPLIGAKPDTKQQVLFACLHKQWRYYKLLPHAGETFLLVGTLDSFQPEARSYINANGGLRCPEPPGNLFFELPT